MATKTPTANPEYALTDLYLYLVDSCNLACGHCWIEPRSSATDGRSIPLDPLKAAIEEARSLGLQRVKLTGGEPLLYPDLNELLAFIAESNLECHVETNGTLLDRKTVRALSAAGIEQVSVSLDAASPKLHDELRGVAGSFDRTVAGVGRLAEQGIRPEIIMTVGRLNRREVPRLMHLVEDLGATSLKINPLIPCGRAKAAFSKGLNLDLDELMELHELTETIRHGMDGLEAYLDLPPAFLAMEEIQRRGVSHCRILNILGILAGGEISLCGIGQTESGLCMGNIRNTTLSAVWEQDPVLGDLRRGLPQGLKGVCGTCIFRFHCLGACRANAYSLDRDLYAPYFLCRELEKAGRFPASRVVH